MAVSTNPHVSAVHAANFSRELQSAADEKAMQAAAERHSKYLIKADADRLRDEYMARLAQLRGLKA